MHFVCPQPVPLGQEIIGFKEFLQSLLPIETLRFLCGLSTKQCFHSDFTGSSFLINISQQSSLGRFPVVLNLCKGTWAPVNPRGCVDVLRVYRNALQEKKHCQQSQWLLDWIYSHHTAANNNFKLILQFLATLFYMVDFWQDEMSWSLKNYTFYICWL